MGISELHSQIQGLRNPYDAKPESLRLSESTFRNLVENLTLISYLSSKVEQTSLLGISCYFDDRLPIGEIRLVTNRGIEAITVNVATT